SVSAARRKNSFECRQSSSACCLTTRAIGCTKRILKIFPRLTDIHRSGGKLLDNPCLTSRVRSGSLRVDWFARSLINPRAVRPSDNAEEKIKMRSEVFRDGHPDSSVRQLQESSDLEGSHRRRDSHLVRRGGQDLRAGAAAARVRRQDHAIPRRTHYAARARQIAQALTADQTGLTLPLPAK